MSRDDAELARELFDSDYYLRHNPDVAESGRDPLEHFCEQGWKELRRPRADFDVWWYWATYLDPASEGTNPFVHWVTEGRAAGLPGAPESFETRATQALPAGGVRRICLFAGYDRDGVVDDHVVAYVSELSRHADVYYLADGYLPPAELAKLEGITRGAWSARHGAYDFGSYSMLARDLVGWDTVLTYDELLLVNDSCYLLRDLDEVFSAMSATPCDWWGLQATKGLAKTREEPANLFTEPIPVQRVHDELLPRFERDAVYDFHVGSYFVAYRSPVLHDPRFRRILDAVGPQRGKLQVILKFEIGLTHFLVGNGYRFETYADQLYPFHPLFSEWHFTLIEQGFPLLKKYLVYQNHYDVPGLADWRQRVLALVPDAPVDVMEKDLLRTAPDDRLRRSFAITRGPDGEVVVPQVVVGKDFRTLDRQTPVDPLCWAFPVGPDDHRLPPNSRAVFEAVRLDPSIRKVVLTRSRAVDLDGENVVVAPLLSPEGQQHLFRSGEVFVRGEARRTLGDHLSPDHRLHLVRDGLLLGRDGRPVGPERRVSRLPVNRWHSVLTSSDLDQLAVLALNYPVLHQQGWRTGIPAHDFLLCGADQLPGDLARTEQDVRAELDGRRLLLVMPERSGADRAGSLFTDGDVAELRRWSDRTGTVVGVREHPLDLDRPVSRQLSSFALDLSVHRHPSTHAVLRATDAVLTDHSGTALDFAVTGRPVVSYAPDLDEAYPSLVLDPDVVFPGPVCRSLDALMHALEQLDVPTADQAARWARARALLVDTPDGGSAQRVVQRVLDLAREVVPA